MSPATAAAAGLAQAVTVGSERGTLTFPLELDPAMVDGVVWVPAKAPRQGVAEHLGVVPGELVRVRPPVPTAVTPKPTPQGSAT
jgi:NADH-quinone oxidoreductase subunit G